MENGILSAMKLLMQSYKPPRLRLFFPAALLLLSMGMCNLPGRSGDATPTLNVTQAYQTVEARLTQALTQTPPTQPVLTTPTVPSASLSPTTASANTPAPATAIPPTKPPTAARPCDQAAAGNPIDVSIPDDTVMQPNQAFTKIWRLENAGTCTWTRDYMVTYFSGEQMGAPTNVNLRGDVAPGQTVDIPVDMVAPKEPGKYQGNWKLKNPSNVLFGIGPSGGSPFWVRIVVAESATASPTASTSTPTGTVSATPPTVVASGSAKLSPGDRIDLDTLAINSGENEDLSYETNVDGQHLLAPLDSALIGVYGNNQPSLSNCQQGNISTAPVIVDGLSVGTYLCYRTNQGLPGWARVTDLNIDNYDLSLSLLTWSLP